MEEQVGQLVGEGARVVRRREVALLRAPRADRVHDPADELADAPLARGAAERAAEVLRHDDVGRELRPATRYLDVALLEDRLAALALDDGGAHLPLDLVEGVRTGGRESPCDPDAVPRRTRLRPLHHVACRLLRHHAPPRNGMASRIHHHILCCQGIFCNGGST